MHDALDKLQLRLRQLRHQKGLSQVRLAAQAGVALSTISIAERAGYLSARSAEKLAAVLGVAPEELR